MTQAVTVQGRLPSPYVHADSRGLVLCNGPRCVYLPQAQLRMAAEAFAIIAEDKRATRSSGPHVVGGYLDGGDVILYAGTNDDLVSVSVSNAEFDSLRRALAR